MLLTRPPLSLIFHPKTSHMTSFDLHVLGMPPAFILSQDQTLKNNFLLRSYLPASFKKSCWLNCYSSPRLRLAFELTWYYLVFLLFEIVKFLGFSKALRRLPLIAAYRSNEDYYIKLCFVCQQLFLFFSKYFQAAAWVWNGEGGIWTLAPVSRPMPLAGAPLRPLEYFSKVFSAYYLILHRSSAEIIIANRPADVKVIFHNFSKIRSSPFPTDIKAFMNLDFELF